VRRGVAIALVIAASPAAAEPTPRLERQLQLDVGIGVIAVGQELPVSPHLAVALEATGFSTFFLPLVGGGVAVTGAGAGVRPTWFAERSGHGLFASGSFLLEQVGGDKAGTHGHGLAYAASLQVGQAFRASRQLDVRLAFGPQWIHYEIPTAAGALTANVPFLAIDLVIGYRL